MRPLTILVVEFNTLMAAALEQLLRSSGHEVVVVPDGASALVALEEWSVDVILNDIDDAEIDGVTLIQSLPDALQRRVVYLAGAASEPAVPDGAILLQKPSRGHALRAAVERAAAE